MAAENHESVLATAVLDDLAGGEGASSGGWSINRTGKSCESSIDSSGIATLPAGAIIVNESRELVRVGGFDVILDLSKISLSTRFDRTLAISSVTSLSPSRERAAEARPRTKFPPRIEICFQTRL
jgi:hypothetical protein